MVKDTGCGMDEETLRIVKVRLAGNYDTSFKDSIGIYNVNSRLKMRFGEKYGLLIESRKGSGTEVKIPIPLMTKPKEDNNVQTVNS